MATVNKKADRIAAANARSDKAQAVIDELETMPRRSGDVLGGNAPYATTGPVGQEKAFSLYNFIRNGCAYQDWDSAKHERYVLDRFKKALMKSNSLLADNPGGHWLPMNLSHFGPQLTESSETEEDIKYVKAVMKASAFPASDPDEEAWLIRRGAIVKASSAFVEGLGGTLVAPPVQGDVIPLIRPEAAVLAAGATSMALPPNGRYVAPRITGAPTAAATGEGQTTLVSDMTTDQMVLTAKKISGGATISEESTAFTSGTLDQYVMNELNRTLGLKMDAFAFYGEGGNLMPAGLTHSQYASLIVDVATTYTTARGIGVDGNALLPEYADAFEALIGERSFNMDSESGTFIMRPGAWASVTGARADAVTAGDKAGVKVDTLRRLDEDAAKNWAKKKVVRTTNIKGNLTKGSGTSLSDVFFGIWKHCVFATYGAMQFSEGHNGTTFLNGQRIIRGVMYGDVGFQYPAAFLWYTKVKGVTQLL